MIPRTRTFVLLLGAALAVATVAAFYSRRPSAAAPRLVLVYATCTLNKDYLSPYNPSVTYTPFLGDFSRRAVVFTNHFGEAGRSAIDFAALFSGNDAADHGVFANGDHLADDVYTMAEAFRDAGYDTFFWNAHPFAGVTQNFAQGFAPDDIFDGNAKAPTAPYSKRPFLRGDDPRFGAVLDTLKADAAHRAFVLTNFSVTHGPYADDHLQAFCARHPAECLELPRRDYARYRDLFVGNFVRFTMSFRLTADALKLSAEDRDQLLALADITYRSNVWYLDTAFGEVIDAIRERGLLDDTLIVFTTDHGELLQRENFDRVWYHEFDLVPEVLHIPLLIAAPGVSPRRYDDITRSIDVFPTIAAVAGVSVPPLAGHDLSRVLLGRDPAPPLLAFSHTALPPRVGPGRIQVSVRDRERKFELRNDGARLAFDLSADPYERTDRYDGNDPSHVAMYRELQRYKQRLAEGFMRRTSNAKPLSAEEIERLRMLGYAE